MPYYKHEDIEELMDLQYERARELRTYEEHGERLKRLDARMAELMKGSEEHDRAHKDKSVEVFVVKGTENAESGSMCYTQCNNGGWARQSTYTARQCYKGVFRCATENRYSHVVHKTPEDLGALLFTIVALPSGAVIVEES